MPKANSRSRIVSTTKGIDAFLSGLEKSRSLRDSTVTKIVQDIINQIRLKGDSALFAYAKKFDGITLTKKSVRLTDLIISKQAKLCPPTVQTAITEASKRIDAFHAKQLPKGFSLKTKEGTLTQEYKPLERIAIYIPGGKAMYPSSVLMNAIPAKIAGVKEIVAVTPVRELIQPSVAYALKLLDIKEIYAVGGAQAIAALALGTESIKPVQKIVGPGNAYVQTAKRMLYGLIDIDSVAGPSEVVIIADSKADPYLVALDLLAQAEHGSGDELAVCITEDLDVAKKIEQEIANAILKSPRRAIIEKLPLEAISIMVTKSRKESIALSNSIAPEHLQIMTSTYKEDVKSITNASAIFLGEHTPVALGDYFIGTNHVLPTGGGARFGSPLGVESFLKRVSIAEVSKNGLLFSRPFVSALAREEGFVHHAFSVENRFSPQ